MRRAAWLALLLSGALGAAEPATASTPTAASPAAATTAAPIDQPRPAALRQAALAELARRAGGEARWLDGADGRYLCLVAPPRRHPLLGTILVLGETEQRPGEAPWQAPLAEALRDLGWQVAILASEALPKAGSAPSTEPDGEAGLRHGVDAALAAFKGGEREAVFLLAPGASATTLLAKPDSLPPVDGLAGLDARLAPPFEALAGRKLAVFDIASDATPVQLAERRAEAARTGLGYRGLRLVGAGAQYGGVEAFLAREIHAWARELAARKAARRR